MQKLQEFEIGWEDPDEDPDCAWTTVYATDVVEAYRRFCECLDKDYPEGKFFCLNYIKDESGVMYFPEFPIDDKDPKFFKSDK